MQFWTAQKNFGTIYQDRPGFNPRSSHTKDSKKGYLIPPYLTLSVIRYISRVKWFNPGKGVAPSPTPRCSSYWKESLRVGLNYSHQLYLYQDWVCQWPRRPGPNPKSSYTQDPKKVLNACLLITQHYNVTNKWSNPGKGVAPSPTPWCSSFWKRRLLSITSLYIMMCNLIFIIYTWKISFYVNTFVILLILDSIFS